MIARTAVATVLEAGSWAPSFFNLQPWRACVSRDAIAISIDRTRAGSLLDKQARVSLFAIGAFVENAIRAGLSLGITLEPTTIVPMDPFDTSIRLSEGPRVVPKPELLAQVVARDTNRAIFPPAVLDQASLEPFAIDPATGLRFILLTGDQKRAVAEVFGLASAVVAFQERLWTEQRSYLRLTSDVARQTRDGIDLETLAIDDGTRAALRTTDTFARAMSSMDPEAIAQQTTAAIEASSHLVVLTTSKQPEPAVMVEAGRVFESAWIDSSARGVAMHPNGVLGLFALLDPSALDAVLDGEGAADIRTLLQAAGEAMALAPGERLVFAARLSRGGPSSVRSQRRPWSEFTTFDD
jgi:hypothetical protein